MSIFPEARPTWQEDKRRAGIRGLLDENTVVTVTEAHTVWRGYRNPGATVRGSPARYAEPSAPSAGRHTYLWCRLACAGAPHLQYEGG